MPQRKKLGDEGEEKAVQFLREQGYTILERNYRFQYGEIDIVAQEGEELVFVEVKTRESSEYGSPEDALTEIKEERIRTAAEGYYFEHQLENQPCRIDFIGVLRRGDGFEIHHIKNIL